MIILMKMGNLFPPRVFWRVYDQEKIRRGTWIWEVSQKVAHHGWFTVEMEKRDG